MFFQLVLYIFLAASRIKNQFNLLIMDKNYEVKNTQKFNYEKNSVILKGIRCLFLLNPLNKSNCRSQWPRGLKRGSAVALLLGLWV